MARTRYVILSEGDMEYTINRLTKLALEPGENKHANIIFPSDGLMCIFMNNLFKSFIVNRVPQQNNLDLILNVPDEQEN